MNLQHDIEVLSRQEAALRFRNVTADSAWHLGGITRRLLLERCPAGVGGSVEIEVNHHVLFACTTRGATPGQADWIRRKRNTVRRFARSSYAIGRELALKGESLTERHGLDLRDFAAHGGGFPLLLEGDLLIGTIVVSGLPQRDDHNLAVDALAEFLGVDAPRLG